MIRHTEIFAPLRALDLPVGHVVTVLEEMGIFEDDSAPSFERWLVGRLEGLAPGIRSEAERWTRVLGDGGPRSLPRWEGTVWLSLNQVRPALLEWSNRCHHLREVTRDDVLTYVKTLHGHQRRDQLVALRLLFTWAKRHGLAFRNPTSRIKAGQNEYSVLQPLLPEQVESSVAAATTLAARLVLALAAVHAARVAQIATLERLRVDRQLEEAMVHGPDPLHLAEVFGLDEKTATRYPDPARQLLLASPGETLDGTVRGAE